MTKTLAATLDGVPQVEIIAPVETNALFLRLPAEAIPVVQAAWYFPLWDPEESVVRIMTSWDTTAGDVAGLADSIRAALR